MSDIIDAAKVIDDSNDHNFFRWGRSLQIRTNNRSYPAYNRSTSFVSTFHAHYNENYRQWQEDCRDWLSEQSADPRNPKRSFVDRAPKLFVKKFASGIVLASRRLALTTLDRELSVIETEASGVAAACRAYGSGYENRFIVIRGISDTSYP